MRSKNTLKLIVLILLVAIFVVTATMALFDRPNVEIQQNRVLSIPDFTAYSLISGNRITDAVLENQGYVLLNVWASWCVACREEHPLLVAFAKQSQVPVVGLSYKEIQPQDEAAKLADNLKLQVARERSEVWLKRHGNPYVTSVMDLDGRVGINYGVYGVPETYIIDKQGVIRYKRVGPLTPQILIDTLLPLIQTLEAS